MSDHDTRNSIWLPEARPCWHCGTPTHWAARAFEAPLCPGPCTKAKGREYDVATHGYTCPRCGRTSYHPEDARHGYCGACHDYTGGDVVKTTMTTAGGKHVLVLGLSRENTRRLHDGLPIPIEVHDVDPRLPELTVLLMAGETEEAITAELRTSVQGRPQ